MTHVNHLDPIEKRVYDFIHRISPERITNTDLGAALHIEPHYRVYLITQRLLHLKLVAGSKGEFLENEWSFWAVPTPELSPSVQPHTRVNKSDQPRQRKPPKDGSVIYEELVTYPEKLDSYALPALQRHYHQEFKKGEVPGMPGKVWDFISADKTILGDALSFYPSPHVDLNPAASAQITERVWLLEKSQVRNCFLVFGICRSVPMEWLKLHAHYLQNIPFYFLTQAGTLSQIN